MTSMQKTDGEPTLSDADLAPAGLPFLTDDPDDKAVVSGTISAGVSWSPSSRGIGGVLGKMRRKAGSDLDLSAVLFQDRDPVTLCIGFDDLKNPMHSQPGDGSIVHSGDNTTGEGDGDDETIVLRLDKIPAEFHRIVLQVSAFKGKNKKLGDQGFQGANNVLITVYDGEGSGAERAFCIRPSLLGTENCVLVAVLDRVGNTTSWEMSKRKVRVNVKYGDLTDLIRKAAAAN